MEVDTGHWVVEIEMPEDAFGFIYEITSLVDGRKYIGKKQMTRRIKRQPLKGKKRKRICNVESDWKKYTGSCEQLNEDIITYSTDEFLFEILKFCKNKYELNYFEAKLQFEREVLLNDDYYNGQIRVRLGRPPKTFTGT